jgi:hypothetical protein
VREPAGRISVVQFPHPGAEHDPGRMNRQPWNEGAHKRKFLRSEGAFVAGDGQMQHALLAFWAEWEPPSLVVERWAREGRKPCFLCEPVWEHPQAGRRLMNTDPWVFGAAFRYSNCRQRTSRGPTALQRLAVGSMVLFGSKLAGEFVVDTVFVVGEAQPLTTQRIDSEADEAFRVCTLERLGRPGGRRHRFVLYRGATAEEPVHGMYSFVPCRRADASDYRFERPVIELPGYVNPASGRGPSGTSRRRSIEEVREQWAQVRRRVIDAGCLIGVRFSNAPARVRSA